MGSGGRPAAAGAATIEGNLAFTDTAAWAWFALPTQRWAFRADGERLNLIVDAATRLATFAGRKLHLRVTSRPYPAASWARALDARTPSPLPGVVGESWADHWSGPAARLAPRWGE